MPEIPSAVILIPLGKLAARKFPRLDNTIRRLSLFVLGFVVITTILSYYLAFALNDSSKWDVYLAILGTFCFFVGVLSLLALCPGILPRLMLFTAKLLRPVEKCETHSRKLRQTFDSFDLLMQRNAHSAWLLPPPSFDVVSDSDHGLDYLELEFREWSWLVTGNKGRVGLIEDTQYLFITWHWPHSPNDSDRSLVEKLGDMLTKVGEYTNAAKMVVHRVLVGPWLKMSTAEWNNFKTIVWNPYFAPFCDSSKANYRILFVDLDAIGREFSSRGDRLILENFLDVALFSFDSKAKKLVQDNKDTILPFPEEYPTQRLAEYAALQYSERFDGFLALQAVQGTSARERGTKYGDGAIRERRLAVKEVWKRARNLKNINTYVKKEAAIDFVEL